MDVLLIYKELQSFDRMMNFTQSIDKGFMDAIRSGALNPDNEPIAVSELAMAIAYATLRHITEQFNPQTDAGRRSAERLWCALQLKAQMTAT